MNNKLSFHPDEVIHHKIGNSYFAKVDNPPMSIKCMLGGNARYRVGNRRDYLVDEKSFLILNEGSSYSITKSAEKPVETFCVFFLPWMMPTVVRDLTTDSHKLLDCFADSSRTTYNLYERRYSHGGVISHRLQSIRYKSTNHLLTVGWLEEELYFLLLDMIANHQNIERKVSLLSATKATTKRELYRRLYWAKDYIHANFNERLSLSDIASVATLSPFHFLRSFQQLFNMTPHTYMTQQRIDTAKHLLTRTSMSVTEIATAVGYESLPSFINLFKSRIGCTPLQYRR